MMRFALILLLLAGAADAQIVQFSGTSVSGGAVPAVNAASFSVGSDASGLAKLSQAIGTATATNTPTSFTISSCSGCTNYFAISSGGAITVTSTGVSGIVPSWAGQTYSLVVNATNGSGTGGNTTLPITFYPDGRLDAPTATATYASTINGYSYGARPSFQVPDWDYGVGYPTGQSFTAWSAFSNGNCTVDTGASRYIRCDGGAGNTVTLNGIDFSTTTGAYFYVPGGSAMTAVTITNSKFACGTDLDTPSGYFIQMQKDIALTITNSTFDGTNCTGTTADQTSFIGVNGGSLTMKYLRMSAGNQHILEQVSGVLALTVRYSSHYQMARGLSHMNYVQWNAIGAGSTADWQGNLGLQTSLTASAAGEGPQWYPNSGTQGLNTVNMSGNVFLARKSGTTSVSYWVHGATTTSSPTAGTNTYNFFDTSGCVTESDSCAYYRSGTDNMGAGNNWTNTGNKNINTGAAISP